MDDSKAASEIPCIECGAKCQADKRFCSDCGGALDPLGDRIHRTVNLAVARQVRDILKSDYKDQKVLEVETVQAVVSRLTEWAKLFGFLLGIPLTGLILILTTLGLRTYSDFSKLVHAAQHDVESGLAAAQKQADKLKADGAKLKAKGDELAVSYENLHTKLVQATNLSQEVKTLSDRVEQIDEKLGFTKRSKVSESLKALLSAKYIAFQDYLRGLGYKPARRSIGIDVRREFGSLAYYDLDKNLMVIDDRYADDEDLLYREYMHHVLYGSQKSDAAEERLWAYYAIESSLATYFPCSFTGRSRSGEKTSSKIGSSFVVWDLSRNRQFKELRADIAGAMGDDTEIWGSAFWALRSALGQSFTDRLLLDAWFKLKPKNVLDTRGAQFVQLLIDADRIEAQGVHGEQIRKVFLDRGLSL